jgi:hypothetical protein
VVEPAVPAADLAQERAHVRLVGDVGEHVVVPLVDPLRRLAAASDDLVPGREVVLGERAAQALPGAGDDRDRTVHQRAGTRPAA